MKDEIEGNGGRVSRRLLGCVAAFWMLHVVALWAPLPALWSLDLLAYGPDWSRWTFVLGGAALALLAGRPALVRLVAPMGSALDRPLVLGVLYVGLFVALRSALHLLGDGYLMLREVEMRAVRSGNEPLALYVLDQLHIVGLRLGANAEQVLRTYSYASGVLYVLLAFSAAAALRGESAERRLVTAALLTAGYMQIFCGYIETYALLFPGILAYVLIALRYLRGGRYLLWAPLFLALLTTYHYIAFMLSPSLLALAWSARQRGQSGWAIALQLLPSPLFGLAVLRALGIDPLAYASGLRGGHILPITAPPDFAQAYGLLAPAHLLDMVNVLLLAAPIGALLICSVGIHRRRDAAAVFLALAALGPLLFSFCANPEIGAFRDWDILSAALLPTLLWVLYSARLNRLEPAGGMLIIGAVALHALSWLALNADAESALYRYETLMRNGALSQHARSYGWESVGSHYRQAGRHEKARGAFAAAVAAHPGNVRHWQALAAEYAAEGNDAQAERVLREALQRHAGHAPLWDQLGSLYAARENWTASAAAHRRATELDMGFGVYWFNLGNALMGSGQTRAGVEAYRTALQRGEVRGEIYFNLGMALQAQGEFDAAIEALLLAAQRRYAPAHFRLALLYLQAGQRDAARHQAEQFWAVEGASARADQLRTALQN